MDSSETPPNEQRSPSLYIAIGASGSEGLNDITRLLADLDERLPVVILVVLHRPADKVSHLRAILARASGIPVVFADDHEQFRAGFCYVGEPASHLTMAARNFPGLIDDTAKTHRNRTVDLLFKSVARFAKERAVAVVLSGSLDDGSRGAAAIHAAGGTTMVLASEGIPGTGMPRNAVNYDGPIDVIGTAAEIADEIGKLSEATRRDRHKGIIPELA